MSVSLVQVYDNNSSSWKDLKDFPTIDNGPRYIGLNYIDSLQMPQKIEIKITNARDSNNINVFENLFSQYQKIRVKESKSGEYIFYGKIEKVVPKYDTHYGQVLILHAKDNLAELEKNTINGNVNYTGNIARGDTNVGGNLKRGDVIRHIINGVEDDTFPSDDDVMPFNPHSISGNIITQSPTVLNSIYNIDSDHVASDISSFNFRGAKKKVLRVIQEIASEEIRDLDEGDFSFDFFLGMVLIEGQ